jgi:OOP family OmpA-OmpF porin
MYHSLTIRKAFLVGCLGYLTALPLSAVEVLTKEDFVKGIVKEEQLVKTADNAIFVLDTSSSMNDKFEDTGKTKLELVMSEFKSRNTYFPNLGHYFGIYTYTPWKVILPVALYDRDKVATALNTVREKGDGPTPIKKGLEELQWVLKSLPGRTAVFIWSDGEYTGGSPREIAKQLAADYNVCFYVISTAKPEKEATLKQDVASLNSCSRMISLSDFLNRPEYTTAALFDVRVTEKIVTTTETKLAGLKVDDINFDTDKSELTAKNKSELDALAGFMKGKPESYAVIAGYTDNSGTEDYNEGLSRRRAEHVATYLKDTHGLTDSQMILHWYGSDNPLVSNDSPENMAKNRRVEVNVGGL